mmetsp:Transcript_1614/g.4349  ORF Transcript_1614/g.4349 Transcript_1614/m.4349 type:complete len:235 (+) Transcript_1614:504-1208(+)
MRADTSLSWPTLFSSASRSACSSRHPFSSVFPRSSSAFCSSKSDSSVRCSCCCCELSATPIRCVMRAMASVRNVERGVCGLCCCCDPAAALPEYAEGAALADADAAPPLPCGCIGFANVCPPLCCCCCCWPGGDPPTLNACATPGGGVHPGGLEKSGGSLEKRVDSDRPRSARLARGCIHPRRKSHDTFPLGSTDECLGLTIMSGVGHTYTSGALRGYASSRKMVTGTLYLTFW